VWVAVGTIAWRAASRAAAWIVFLTYITYDHSIAPNVSGNSTSSASDVSTSELPQRRLREPCTPRRQRRSRDWSCESLIRPSTSGAVRPPPPPLPPGRARHRAGAYPRIGMIGRWLWHVPPRRREGESG